MPQGHVGMVGMTPAAASWSAACHGNRVTFAETGHANQI